MFLWRDRLIILDRVARKGLSQKVALEVNERRSNVDIWSRAVQKSVITEHKVARARRTKVS